jgi:hypothetical protein
MTVRFHFAKANHDWAVGEPPRIRDNPVELFFEIAPEITIRGAAAFGRYTLYSDGVIGLRYYL